MTRALLILFIFFSFLFAQAQNFPFLISEIMYNPEGNDLQREWIEVLNQSHQVLKIIPKTNGWRLINNDQRHIFKEELTINPGEFFIIVQKKDVFLQNYQDFRGKLVEVSFSLKNEGGHLQIIDEKNSPVSPVLNYQKSCGGYNNGYSLVFTESKCYENKIKNGTPGRSDYQLETNIETEDFESEDNFVYINDQKTENQELVEQEQEDIVQEELNIETENTQNQKLTTLIISEFLPNPQGNDQKKEFIELYNYGEEEINLDGFVLEIGNKKIKLSGFIQAGEYFLITNKDYPFSIRNSGETLNLYYQNEKIFSLSYNSQAPEGKSFSRIDNKWLWTVSTPGKENLLIKEEKIFSKEDPNQPLIDQKAGSKSLSASILNQQQKSSIFENNLIFIIFSLVLIIILNFLVFFNL